MLENELNPAKKTDVNTEVELLQLRRIGNLKTFKKTDIVPIYFLLFVALFAKAVISSELDKTKISHTYLASHHPSSDWIVVTRVHSFTAWIRTSKKLFVVVTECNWR